MTGRRDRYCHGGLTMELRLLIVGNLAGRFVTSSSFIAIQHPSCQFDMSAVHGQYGNCHVNR